MTALEKNIYDIIQKEPGLKGRQIAVKLNKDKTEINALLAKSKDLKMLVEKRADYGWYLKTEALEKSEGTYSAKPIAKRAAEGTIAEFVKKQPVTRSSHIIGQDVVPETQSCPLCGNKLVAKAGKFGKFFACSDYPACKFTAADTAMIKGNCPKCGRDLVEGKTKKGIVYYRCSAGRDCGFITWHVPTEEKCKKCGKTLFWPKRTNDRVCLNLTCPNCDQEFAAQAEESATETTTNSKSFRKPTLEDEQQSAQTIKKHWNNI